MCRFSRQDAFLQYNKAVQRPERRCSLEEASSEVYAFSGGIRNGGSSFGCKPCVRLVYLPAGIAGIGSEAPEVLMFTRLSDRITESFVQTQTIPNTDREIYRCGVQLLLEYIVSIAATLAIGILCGMFWQSAVFTAAYMLLRHCAGGYHAETPFRCSIISALLIAAALQAIRYLPCTLVFCCPVLLVSTVLIVCLSPVETKNKPFDATERRVFRCRARRMAVLEAGVALLLLLLHLDRLAACLIVAIAVMSVMLLVGILKNLLCNDSETDVPPRSEAPGETE